jgi:hypothetical protein
VRLRRAHEVQKLLSCGCAGSRASIGEGCFVELGSCRCLDNGLTGE